MRVFDSPTSRTPEVHLLSNGRYHLAISNAGGGYSRWRDLAVTRWREDGTRDCWGTFIYLRDAATGEFWSVAYQPTLRQTEQYEVVFAGACAEYRQRQGDLEIRTEICVAVDDDVELRRVTLTNHSDKERSIELTSYAEVVLAVPGADAAHPVFSNLFVQTEFVRANSAILCTRRPRSEGERRPWLWHSIVGEEGAGDEISCETDRARFVGRGRTPISPAAMQDSSPLSGTVGSVLDPIVSLRRTFNLAPKQTVRVDFMQGVTENREAALALVGKYRDPLVIDHAFDLARTDVALGQLGASESDAQTYCATGRRLDLRRSRSARCLERVAGKPARPKWTLEVWHLRRYPDRPLANQRPSQDPAREATHPGAFLLAAKSAAGGPGYFDREGFGF